MYLVGEVLTDVHHVRADGAGGQRAITREIEVLALAEIHRHRDHLGIVGLLQPRDRDRRVEAA